MTEAAVRDGPRSDAELWRLIAADDHQAFTDLFERHAQTVWNYAYKLTASWSAADDLLATTFMTAWRRRGEVRLVRDSALPWLYTVTANLCRGERRRLSRFLRLVPKLATTESTPDHAEKFAQDNATQARLRRVLAAIERLPPKEREAVQVCLLGGTSAADAAELFGISETSVRSRLSRARSRLHELSQETSDE
ncbi:RNA polymerase subunit sigma-70 [Kibdelosporangium aridum]|uniref:RNA polymerase subunit sigma-70 n=1 Tax=Kibdelosporangium aridum TaxID=2030 RepID=A0A428ZV09_KIBAR|nr:RNA polymerase subunit sigma-70 [Kibdelosporangium aridum]